MFIEHCCCLSFNYKVTTPRGEWESYWFNTFTPTERDIRLYGLAKEYSDRCESYDRAVSPYIDEMTGEGVPINGHQLRLIDRHSREVMADILIKNPEYTRRDIIDYFNRYHL
jgi:hypothetical protein